MRKSILIGCIFASIIAGISIGIFAHKYNDTVMEQAMLEETENVNKYIEKNANIIETMTNKEKTSPNAKIVYETFYTGCNHMSEEDIEVEDVNQPEDYFKIKYNDWDVKNFSENKVELYKEAEGICDKHYVVKEADGYVAVYTLDSDGNQNLKEVTDILTTYLPEEDINLLEKGITANGDNELARIISDYE